MDSFVIKAEQILLNKPNDSDKMKCTVKVLRFLNGPHCSTPNINLIRSLLLDLQGSMKYVAIYDMIQLQMVRYVLLTIIIY